VQIDDEENVTLIDFPQMVSTSHPNAEELFDRDVHGVVSFFERKLGDASVAEDIINSYYPSFQEAIAHEGVTIDKQLRASGFQVEHQKVLDRFLNDTNEDSSGDGSDTSSNNSDDDEADALTSGSDDDTIETGSHAAEPSSSDRVDSDEHCENEGVENDSDDAESDSSSGVALEEGLSTLHLNKQHDESLRQSKEQQVAKRLANQKRQQARQQYAAKATRNSMKSKNKGKRKGEASGNKPLTAGAFGW
jgi:RIO kinase 2